MRIRKWAAIAILPLMLSACSLLPVEEEYTNSTLIKNYTPAEYKMAYCLSGDVQKIETLSLKYMSAKTETLSFPIGGLYFNETYVNKGDFVTAGTLLVDLDCSNLQETIDQLKQDITSIEREIRQTEERRDLAVSSQEKLLSLMSPDEAKGQKTAEDIRESYDEILLSLNDKLTIAKMRLEEQETALNQRRLVAGIDGVVTYLRTVPEGAKSVEGEAFVAIADAENHVFSGETLSFDLLPAGSIVTITANKEEMQAEVISAEDLGMTESYNAKGERKLYFRLLEPNADLETNDRGSISLLIDESKDTLYIPIGALHQVGDRYFVYKVDENGLKYVVDVMPGLMTVRYVEILEGLSEGDSIILE